MTFEDEPFFNQLINSIHPFNFYESKSGESTGKTGDIPSK